MININIKKFDEFEVFDDIYNINYKKEQNDLGNKNLSNIKEGLININKDNNNQKERNISQEKDNQSLVKKVKLIKNEDNQNENNKNKILSDNKGLINIINDDIENDIENDLDNKEGCFIKYSLEDFKDLKIISRGSYGKVFSAYSIKDKKEICLKK